MVAFFNETLMRKLIAAACILLSLVGCEKTRVVYLSPETGKEVPAPIPKPKPPRRMDREFPGFDAYVMCSPDGAQYVVGKGSSGGLYVTPRVRILSDGRLIGFKCDRSTNEIVYKD